MIAAARAVYSAYVREGLADSGPLPGGWASSTSALLMREPRLFQLLFMQESRGRPEGGSSPAIEEHYAEILQSVRDSYGVDGETAEAFTAICGSTPTASPPSARPGPVGLPRRRSCG